MKHRKITIDQLRVGMFIHEMDLPWLQNPFFRKRLAITSDNEIKQLRDAGAKALTIDLSLGCDIANTPATEPDPKPLSESEEAEPAQAPTAPATISIKELKADTAAAQRLKDQTMASLNEITQQLVKGEGLSQAQLDNMVDELVENIQQNQQAILSLLINSESNQPLTSHLYNVMVLGLSLASYLGLPDEELTLLGQAALLHDIGWSKLPTYLLTKGREYSAAEAKLAKQSTVLTQSLLKSAPDLNPVIMTLIGHYEQLSTGKAVPKDKLDKFRVPRLLALCDEYEELTHALKGKSGVLPAKAMKLLYQREHKWADDKLISAMVRLMGIYPLGSAVQLKSGEKGIIIRVRADNPLQSQVLLKYDASGKALKEDVIVLLDSKQGIEIDQYLDPAEPGVDPDKCLVMEAI